MNDTQILTLALSIAVPLGLLIYSNSRIADDLAFERFDQKPDAILKTLAGHETKLQR